ncbi:hypothetical protein [Streptomyces sp. NPDC089919]|uniref:hypothetical protein n=1 Tax=Streptomyces sp. NPDC089919 TaxID=3155188 RepID=UPI00341C671E
MHEVILAAVTDGSAISHTVVVICGNLLLAVLAVKGLQLSFNEDFGKKISFLGGAVFCAVFVWIPDQAKGLVTDLAKVISS